MQKLILTSKCIGMFLKGDAVDDCSYDIEKLNDDNFFIIFNAEHSDETFKLPPQHYSLQWVRILNTCNEDFLDEETFQHDATIEISALPWLF